MSKDEYWIGKGIDLEALWRDYDGGRDYEAKVYSARVHVLRLTFGHPELIPLFDHEVIYKTVKGTFHDVKEECFTREEYEAAAPIFLHRVARGSGIFEFLGQLDPILTWVCALGGAAMWWRTALVQDQEIDERRLDFLRREFPAATRADTRAYLKAWTTFGRRRVLFRLIDQGLHRVEVSRVPVDEDEGVPSDMVDVLEVISRDHEGGA